MPRKPQLASHVVLARMDGTLAPSIREQKHASKLKEERSKLLIALRALRFPRERPTLEVLGKQMGVTAQTALNWLNEHPDLAARWKALTESYWP